MLLLSGTVAAQSTLPLEENFDYGPQPGTLVEVSNGAWTAHSGTSGPVQYDPTTTLAMAGYPASGIGGAAAISSSGAEDVNRLFDRPPAGDVYVAALVSLESAGGGFFYHLKDDGLYNFPGKIWARDSGGNLQFGFSNGSTPAWSAQNFSYNTTYLVVVKYGVTSGASALYVLSSHTPFEPATPLLSATGTPIAVVAVAMRQSAFSPVTPNATIDGIRIATTWLEAVGAPIAVAKSAPDVVVPGETFAYVITSTNNTDLALTGLVVTDTVPLNATFVAASDDGLLEGGVVRWTVEDPLAPGASVLRSFEVIAPNIDGALVVNDEYGAAADNWPTPGVGSPVTTSVLLPPPPDLVVTKSGFALAIPGETLVYTLGISNTESTIAEDVVLTERLPAGTTYVADDIGGCSMCGPGIYTWELGAYTANMSTTHHITVTVSAALPWGAALTNEAEVSSATAEDDLSNNSASLTTLVYDVISIAEARARVGQTVMIEGTVTAEPGIFVDSSTSRKMYMQDDTAGILVYRYAGLNPVARSHRVRVAGQVQVSAGETQIVPVLAAHAIDLGPTTPVVPLELATGAVDEPVEGELVQVYGMIVSKPAPYILNVDDGSGVVQVYRYISLGLGTSPNFIDTSPYEVGNHLVAVGVSAGWESGGVVVPTVLPRGPNDLRERFVTTFVYRDLEDVVWPGEGVSLVGDFNGWLTSANPLATDAANSVFSTTVTLDEPSFKYQFVVDSGGEHWQWLNTEQRSAGLSGSTTIDCYRNVDVSFAQLVEPASMIINLGESTGPVSGQVGIPEVTDPPGEGRAVWAEVGYGTGTNTASWTWTSMSYAGMGPGAYDVYDIAALQPTASGVYSYAVRFDGNRGAGNPNAGWTAGDLDGTGLGDGFEVIETGVLTVTGPILSMTKGVLPAADVAPGGTVTYTLTISNGGDGPATDMAMVDVLPATLTFGGWIQQGGATESAGTIGWSGDLEPGSLVTIVFMATVDSDRALLGQTIVNNATYTSGNGGSGSASAAFAMQPRNKLYLPLVVRGFGP